MKRILRRQLFRMVRFCTALCLLCGLIAARTAYAVEATKPGPSESQSVEKVEKSPGASLNPAIFVGGPRSGRSALEAIDRAAEHGHRRLNVVVTIFVDLTDELQVKRYGLLRGPGFDFQAFDSGLRQQFKERLHSVFAKMVERDMDVFVLCHIDAGGEVREWRNWVDFDPLQEINGYSYEHLMIDTVAEALAETVKPDTRVEIAVSGEMGTSLFRHPASYAKLISHLRERSDLKQLKIGVSLNHNKIAGNENPTGEEDVQLTDDARKELQGVIDSSDFVGFSFYRPVSVQPTADDFVRGIGDFMGELQINGLSVPAGKPLQFSEVGIGGGRENEDSTTDPAQAAESPWAGTGNPRENPWRSAEMKSLRRQYHDALLDFLNRQPGDRRVSAAFLWSMGSWDPLGWRQEEFADPEIAAAVEKHNRSVAGE